MDVFINSIGPLVNCWCMRMEANVFIEDRTNREFQKYSLFNCYLSSTTSLCKEDFLTMNTFNLDHVCTHIDIQLGFFI